MAAFFDPRWAPALGWALLHFLWQGALVGLVAALILRWLTRSDLRYAVACAALALCVLLPTGTALHEFRSASRVATELTLQAHFEPNDAPPSLRIPASPSLLARLETSLRPQLPRVVLLWALGCALLALRLGSGWIWALRWKRLAKAAPEAWMTRLRELSKPMGLTRAVRLRASGLVDTPLALGLWKPVILVPASLFTGMAPELLEALLAHELAHIRRHDYLVNLLQSFVEVMLFYHPAVWWISRRIRIEREFLADERASSILGEPRRLALALNALDDLQPLLATPALAARGGHLMNRIQRLLSPLQDPRRISAPVAWLAPALLASALLTPLAAAVIQETKTEDLKVYAPAALVEKIDALAKEEGIDPDLLRSIAWTESHFNPEALSRNGAKGILQVMPETALKFGATNLDDPDQVARAGAHYLRHLLDTYQGDLTKAVPAYNGGESAVASGQLSDETRAYTPAVLALFKAHAVQPDMNSPSVPSGLPVPGATITQAFGNPRAHVAHTGVDLKDSIGTSVQATADGTVLSAGNQGDLGITVILQHGNGVETLYAHLAEARVKEGQRVTAGTIIGTLGRTGKTTGPHVHYEVRKNGKPVNPDGNLLGYRDPQGPMIATNRPLGFNWEEGGVSGELQSNPDGTLDVPLKIRCAGGFKFEIIPEGETKAVGQILCGSTDPSEKESKVMAESFPKLRFKNENPGKRLRIRCTENAGKGRWGETFVTQASLPVNFAFPLDHEPLKN